MESVGRIPIGPELPSLTSHPLLVHYVDIVQHGTLSLEHGVGVFAQLRVAALDAGIVPVEPRWSLTYKYLAVVSRGCFLGKIKDLLALLEDLRMECWEAAGQVKVGDLIGPDLKDHNVHVITHLILK